MWLKRSSLLNLFRCISVCATYTFRRLSFKVQIRNGQRREKLSNMRFFYTNSLSNKINHKEQSKSANKYPGFTPQLAKLQHLPYARKPDRIPYRVSFFPLTSKYFPALIYSRFLFPAPPPRSDVRPGAPHPMEKSATDQFFN